MVRGRGRRLILIVSFLLCGDAIKAFLLVSHQRIRQSLSTEAGLIPRRHASQQEGEGGNRADGFSDLISRRECLVPAILSLTSGILILSNTIKDESLYDKVHQEIFSSIKGPEFKRLLEIGIGEGVNVKYLPSNTQVIGIDPYLQEGPLSIAIDKAKKKGISLSVQKAKAEHLPFADRAFDAVISTLTFCTIADPTAALAEISRVLRPGGKFVFIEHVEAPEGSSLYYQQELLDPFQALLAKGCHLVRHTDELFRSAIVASSSGGQGGGGREEDEEEGGGGGERGGGVKVRALSKGATLFSKIETFQDIDLGSRWPICSQIAGVLVK